MHFIKDLGEVFRMNNLSVLNLKEVLTTMPIHVDEYFSTFITLQSFRLWKARIIPASDQVKNRFIREVIRLIIHLNVFTI